MGYCVSYDMGVTIPKEFSGAKKAKNEDKLLAAISALHGKNRHYAWTHDPGPDGFMDLKEAFGAWRFDLCDEGDFFRLEWNGEKLGDEDNLFAAIAPFVTGEIDAKGEDGDYWRILFENGKCYMQNGLRTYGEKIEIKPKK